MPKICLNMIVKNESKIIKRLLESVLRIIDFYCICDTGSTDDTVSIITDFFKEKNIPGKITNEPFKDFGHNRTFSLRQCSDLAADYLLLLDADMILNLSQIENIDEFKNSLTLDSYCVFQGTDEFYYKNVRIIKNDSKFSYWGVTHEYVKKPDGYSEGTIEKSVLFINDIGDGGSKTDKFERDIRLLKAGLEQIPNDVRYTFYLANSYRDARQYEKAIETYKKRIELGGWIEEVWHSAYSIGNCYKHMNDIPNAIFYWMQAYEKFPDRIENLYEIVKHFRETSCNRLANIFYEFADFERKKKTNFDNLFLQKDVYDYKIDYEFTVNGYYVNRHNYDMTKTCMKVLNEPGPPRYIKDNVLQNYKSYAGRIDKNKIDFTENMNVLLSIGKTIKMDRDIFASSTPSICFDPVDKNKLIVNLRFVDYRIDDNGGYVKKDNITTKNVIAIIDIKDRVWKLVKEFELKYDTIYDDVYVGIEDIRLFSNENKLFFNGNRAVKTDTIFIESGTINLKSEQTVSTIVSVSSENQRQVEKNWVLFKNNDGETKMIYNWYPITLGVHTDCPNFTVNNKNKRMTYLDITHTIETPPFFRYIRGSGNGITIGNEIWFLTHVVSYEWRRFYYHVFVVLDSTTFQLKRYTKMFTFEKEKVEYSLGFIYFEKTKEFLIGYSLLDRETKYMKIGRSDIDKLFEL